MSTLPIEELTLYAAFQFLGDFKPAELTSLNEVFVNRDVFRSLKKVTCIYVGTVGPKRVRERFKQVLPALADRGIPLVTKSTTPTALLKTFK